MTSYFYLFVLSIMLMNTVIADSRSANFEVKENSLLSKLNFPEIKGNTSVLISCSGIIKKNKKLDQALCYKNQAGDEVYIQEIYKAIKKSRFNPAIINKKVVEVFLQFRVYFKQDENDKIIQLISNAGYEENIEAYGMNYTAAQRVLGEEEWQKHCPKYNRYRLLSKAHLSQNGIASNANVTPLNGININQKCNLLINFTINNSQYIPAHANNEPIPSTYIELFGN